MRHGDWECWLFLASENTSARVQHYCPFACVGHAAANSMFTRTSGPSCLDQSDEYVSIWRCPGPAGYVVGFADEGNIVGIGFGKAVCKCPRRTASVGGTGVEPAREELRTRHPEILVLVHP